LNLEKELKLGYQN